MTGPKKPSVLVVDDTPANIDLMVEILGEDYDVRVALDGASALEDIQSEVPDLILLDIMMPGMDGYEVCRRLMAAPETGNIPVIFVSAKGETVDEVRGFECGAVDYITKPVSPPVVRARVANHLALCSARQALTHQNKILKENVRLREEVERITRHDLKTPLNRVVSLPRILMASHGLSSELRKGLQSIETAGYTMLAMINRSLDLIKMEQGTYGFSPEPVDLHGIIMKICGDLALAVQEKNCRFEILPAVRSEGEEQGFVSGDPLLCYSLAANLIKNAVEACPKETVIRIGLSCGGASTIIFSVHNQGEVPAAVRTRFFEKYATAGKKKGTGLGTYSARLMARTMGGKIRMSTGPETGTRVEVTLPGASGLKPSHSPEPAQVPGTVSWQDRPLPLLKLLIADDDTDNLELLARILAHPALAVDRASDGCQAVDLWHQKGHDIIFMDLEMPGTDGTAAVKMIRAREAETMPETRVTILALSAHDADEMAETCLDAGFDGFLTKPVDFQAIHDQIAGIAGQRPAAPGSPGPGSRQQPENETVGKGLMGPELNSVDWVVLDEDLREIMPGFLENKRSQIQGVLEKIGQADPEEIRRAAHKLKGGFNMYGLSVLGGICADLERAAQTGNEHQMRQLGQELFQRFDRIKLDYRKSYG